MIHEMLNSEIISRGQRKCIIRMGKTNKKRPDIIIGYNTFGFDWHFLLDRADELKL